MTQRERDRLVALHKAAKKLITQKQAARQTGLSERQSTLGRSTVRPYVGPEADAGFPVSVQCALGCVFSPLAWVRSSARKGVTNGRAPSQSLSVRNR